MEILLEHVLLRHATLTTWVLRGSLEQSQEFLTRLKLPINADEGFALAHIGLARNMQLLAQPERVKASLGQA